MFKLPSVVGADISVLQVSFIYFTNDLINGFFVVFPLLSVIVNHTTPLSILGNNPAPKLLPLADLLPHSTFIFSIVAPFCADFSIMNFRLV